VADQIPDAREGFAVSAGILAVIVAAQITAAASAKNFPAWTLWVTLPLLVIALVLYGSTFAHQRAARPPAAEPPTPTPPAEFGFSAAVDERIKQREAQKAAEQAERDRKKQEQQAAQQQANRKRAAAEAAHARAAQAEADRLAKIEAKAALVAALDYCTEELDKIEAQDFLSDPESISLAAGTLTGIPFMLNDRAKKVYPTEIHQRANEHSVSFDDIRREQTPEHLRMRIERERRRIAMMRNLLAADQSDSAS